MLYFLFLWQRPLFIKELALGLMTLPIWCMYLTFSKGAYLSGGITLIAGLLFGRPKIVQVAIVVFALTSGVTIVKSLPRMEELSSREGGIQGRLAAWSFGYQNLHENPSGIGWGKFVGAFRSANGYGKAPHSSYVQLGTEFGKPGLFLFIGLFYVSMRTIVTVKTKTLEEERIRRMCFVLVFSFYLSSWVIDFATRGTLFMNPATVAAFQRQILKRHESDIETAEQDLEEYKKDPETWTGWTDLGMKSPSVAAASAGYTPRIQENNNKVALQTLEARTKEPPPISWDKITIPDVIIVYLMTRQAIWAWGYVLETEF